MDIQVKTRWRFHVNLNLCVCAVCVYVSWLLEEPFITSPARMKTYVSILFQVRTRWRWHAVPTLSATFVALYRNVNSLHQDNCLFCLCAFVWTTWRTFEFLWLHEDVSDHPSRNTMEVSSRTRSHDMNLFHHMKTRVSIQLQWISLTNLIRSLHVNTKCNIPFLLCYIFMSCPILAAHIHVCCFWWNYMTLHHDRYLNLTFNAS